VAINVLVSEMLNLILATPQQGVDFVFVFFAIVESYQNPVLQLVILSLFHDSHCLSIFFKLFNSDFLFDGLFDKHSLHRFLPRCTKEPCKIFLAVGRQ